MEGRDQQRTTALLTDLWPSATDPLAGIFVRSQVDAMADRYRQLVLVPRLLFPRLHRRIWNPPPNGLERGWVDPRGGRLLRYPVLRVPKRGDADARSIGARLALRVAGERPALVHAHFLHEVGVAGIRLARALGVPALVTVHGTDARWLLEGGVKERFRRSMLAAVHAADRVIAVSRPIADGLAAAGVEPEAIAVVPMGVDEQLFRPRSRVEARAELGLDPDRRIIVLVGRVAPEKGINELSVAAAALADVADVVAIAEAGRGIRNSIRHVGAEPPERVALWLAAADVFCLPSWAEGTPVSVSEALAAGRPVVATAVGGIPDQVGLESGILVPVRDPAALTDALRSALTREWDADAIRESSRPFWSSVVTDRLDGFYAEVLSS
jgi:glycosyltransferase involved in cell wall biosynthesis